MKYQLWTRATSLTQNFAIVFVIVVLELAVLTIVRLPGTLQFDNFAFFDVGSNLTAQYLIAHGYRPAIDFGYPYGLLGLFAGRFWFAILPATPWSYEWFMLLSDLLLAWALARLLVILNSGVAGFAFAVLTMPLLVPAGFLTFSHALEAICLFYAFVAHARGRRSTALALTAAAVLAKPSLAYFYGLFLVGFIVLDLRRRDAFTLRSLLLALLPAAVTMLSTASVLVVRFGLRSLMHTILPLAGRKMYAASHFGLFAAGRNFWAPPGVPLSYYFQSAAGFWVVGTICLAAAAFASIVAAWHSGTFKRNHEFVATCAMLHFSFIGFLWGTQYSWTYYVSILVLGLVAVASLSRRWALTVACLAVIFPAAKVGRVAVLHFTPPASNSLQRPAPTASETALAGVSQSQLSYKLWFTTSRRPAMANLWSSADERGEWSALLASLRGRPAMVLSDEGCAAVLYPASLMPPVGVYLNPGLPLPAELQRVRAQLRIAGVVITVSSAAYDQRPEFADLFRTEFSALPRGRYFRVYTRRSQAGPS